MPTFPIILGNLINKPKSFFNFRINLQPTAILAKAKKQQNK